MTELVGSGELPREVRSPGINPVVVPAEATLAKADFHDLAAAESAARAIRLYIEKNGRTVVTVSEETGEPIVGLNAHPYETYSRPVKGAEVVYLTRFFLPDDHRKSKRRRAPCPCCSFAGAKLTKGIVAWFPQDGVIRVIGEDCFKTYNLEGHASAIADLDLRDKREKAIANILRQLPHVEAVREAIQFNLPIAAALDDFREQLCAALLTYRVALWNEIKGGKLRLAKTTIRKTLRAGGGVSERRITERRTYSTIKGQRVVSTQPRQQLAQQLRVCLQLLSGIETTPQYIDEVMQAEDKRRNELAVALQRAFVELVSIERALRSDLQFVSIATLQTLRTWSRHPDAVLSFHFEMADDSNVLFVGASAGMCARIPLPGALRRTLQTMCALRERDLK